MYFETKRNNIYTLKESEYGYGYFIILDTNTNVFSDYFINLT